MTDFNPHCAECLHTLGLSRQHNDARKWALAACSVCGQKRLCLTGRKKILDFAAFFDNAQPKRSNHVQAAY